MPPSTKRSRVSDLLRKVPVESQASDLTIAPYVSIDLVPGLHTYFDPGVVGVQCEAWMSGRDSHKSFVESNGESLSVPGDKIPNTAASAFV